MVQFPETLGLFGKETFSFSCEEGLTVAPEGWTFSHRVKLVEKTQPFLVGWEWRVILQQEKRQGTTPEKDN